MDPDNGLAVVQKKSRKKSKVAVEANCKEEPKPKKRRKAGSLAQLPSMPLDILFEIFGHLPPYDLLKMTRTTKSFRRLLLNKSSITIWKTSLSRVPDLPPCPPEMCEPAWSNLVFSPHCHYCLTYTRTILWYLRIRCCAPCAELHLEGTDKVVFPLIALNPGTANHFFQLVNVVPCEPGKRGPLCDPKSFLELRDKYLALPEDSREAFLKERRIAIEERIDHGKLCEFWAKRQFENRELELRQLRADRVAAVVSKLEELGWGDEIRALPPGALAKQKLVDRPQLLTEKIWHNIKDGVIAFMEDMRRERIKKEFEALIWQRSRPAIDVLKSFKKSKLLEGQLLPEGPDFCNLEPVKDILYQPSEVDIDTSSFDVILPQLPAVLARWREGLRELLLPLLQENEVSEVGPGPSLSVAQRLGLATTVFRCDGCTYMDGFGSPLLFYPQVLGHQCLTRNCLDFDSDLNSLDLVTDVDDIFIRKRWCADGLYMEPRVREMAKEFVALAGLDPSIATVNDMDQLDLRFVCRICADDLMLDDLFEFPDIGSLWTWRAVINHHHYGHSRVACEEIFESYKVIRELPEELKSHELAQEANLSLWSCFHCSDTLSEMRAPLLRTKIHGIVAHDVESPTINEDYFKVFAAEDIAATRPPFWVYWKGGSVSSLPQYLSDFLSSEWSLVVSTSKHTVL